MKQIIFLTCILCLVYSCKTSLTKKELIAENKILKERIRVFETTDSINYKTTLELKKMNVVYRGVSNPIYISKPNAFSFVASAPGLKKTDSLGNYNLNAGPGNTVDIKIISQLKNGDSLTEIKTLRIKDVKPPVGTINDIGCGSICELKLKKEELTNATIGVNLYDFLHDLDLRVTAFKIKMPHYETINISSNKMSAKANDLFTLLMPNDTVVIFDIRIRFPGSSRYRLKGVAPIIIKIIE